LSRVEANTSSARPSLRPFARRYRIFTCPLPQVRCTGPWAMRPWFPRRRALFQSIPEAASYARRRLSLAGRATASRHPARPSQRSVHLADLRMAIRQLRRRQCPPYTGVEAGATVVEAGATVYLLFSSTAPGSYRWPPLHTRLARPSCCAEPVGAKRARPPPPPGMAAAPKPGMIAEIGGSPTVKNLALRYAFGSCPVVQSDQENAGCSLSSPSWSSPAFLLPAVWVRCHKVPPSVLALPANNTPP
jgi:hypothetical protein